MRQVYCRAALNYPVSIDDVAPVHVDIADGRQAELDWQTHGFELLEHASDVSDWYDEAQLKSVYYPEMEAAAQKLTGCDHALIAGHIHRDPDSARVHPDYAAIEYVHSDFTETYGDALRRRYDQAEPGAQAALERAGIDTAVVRRARRILILQFWRSVGERVVDLPLALCDARSVPREDLTAFTVPEYAGEAIPFDTFAVTAPPAERGHRWYTFPAMGRDEAIAFRTFDSDLAERGEAFWTPHSAFRDPLAVDPSNRRSIEVRATCLFV